LVSGTSRLEAAEPPVLVAAARILPGETLVRAEKFRAQARRPAFHGDGQFALGRVNHCGLAATPATFGLPGADDCIVRARQD
jgi:hypothetical protein